MSPFDELERISYPGEKSKKIISISREMEGSGLKTFATDVPDMVLESADGVWLKDPDGNTYLDFFSGYAVHNIGHCHPKVVEAVSDQIKKLTHCPSAFGSEVRSTFVQKIMEITPKEHTRLLFGITGAQANETALNIVTTVSERKEIIAFHGGYFGRTNTMLSINGKTKARVHLGIESRAHFVPYPYCYRCTFGGCENTEQCKVLNYIDDMLTSPASGVGNVAAIFMEPMLGNGGPVVPPKGFLKGLLQICNNHGVLLVLDEIQTGFGRTGRMWASEHYDITPDLMTIGKGIGGGFPVSAVTGREELMTFWKPDTYTSTFLTNPVMHSAAIASIDVMQEEQLCKQSSELGEVLINSLSSAIGDHRLVGDIRGKGLFVGIEMVEDKKKKTPAVRDTKKVKSMAKELGLFISASGYYGNVIKLCPPLTITRDQLEMAMEKLIYIFKQI